MAVSTDTVQVVMPAMGDSVSEGTVLEWHKHEGDTVAADETIVEISTDKVDAEVPSPASGTVVKIYAAEGDTVTVGAVLAEISSNGDGHADADEATPVSGRVPAGVSRGARRRRRHRGREEAATEATIGETIDIVTPAGGESVTEGTILEWSVKVGDTVKDGDTVVEISTDKVDMELPAPAAGTITEILAEDGETVTVGQVIARMTKSAAGASAPAPSTPAPSTAAGAGRARRRRRQHLPGRAADRRQRGDRPRGRRRDRPRRADHEGRRAGGSRERRGRDSRTQTGGP